MLLNPFAGGSDEGDEVKTTMVAKGENWVR